jgi:uncharacterized protein YaeQ
MDTSLLIIVAGLNLNKQKKETYEHKASVGNHDKRRMELTVQVSEGDKRSVTNILRQFITYSNTKEWEFTYEHTASVGNHDKRRMELTVQVSEGDKRSVASLWPFALNPIL